MKKILRIVSRTSALALWQANFVKDALQTLYPNLEIPIIGIKTEGDKVLDVSLSKIGGKGLFVKALEEMLLAETADIAVHSLKDMPAELPIGLTLSTILEREDPRDGFIANHFNSIQELPTNATVGTSSLRRQCQLLALRRDLHCQLLRGNVDTRIRKLDLGEYDGILLAVAGVKRLNLSHRIKQYLSCPEMLPAVGQGALAIECRTTDFETNELLKPLHHIATSQCVLAERSMSAYLQGGCQLPIGGFAMINSEGVLILEGIVGNPKGTKIIKAIESGKPESYFNIGQTVAKRLLEQGADEIINSCAY